MMKLLGIVLLAQVLCGAGAALAGLMDTYRVKFLPATHLKGVPFFIKSTIENKFPKEPENWTLLDYEGLFRKSLDLPKDKCSLVVFDRDGIRRLQVSVTNFEPPTQAQILAAVRRWVR